MTIEFAAVILIIERGAAGRRSAPYIAIEVTAKLGSWGGYFFFCDLKNQTNDADDHKTELKQV